MLFLGKSCRSLPLRSTLAPGWQHNFGYLASVSARCRGSSTPGSAPAKCHAEGRMQLLALHYTTRPDQRVDKRDSGPSDFVRNLTKENFGLNHHSKPEPVKSSLATLVAEIQSRRNGGFSSVLSIRQDEDFESLCEEGNLDKALHILSCMEQQGTVPTVKMYRCLLKACVKRKSLAQAKRAHAHFSSLGLESSRLQFLGECAVSSLVKCGGLEDALDVFNSLPRRTVFSWTALISGYSSSRQADEALILYQRMQEEGVQPNAYTFVSLLKACGRMGNLKEGKHIHAEAVKYNFGSDLFVRTCLVDMYAKCGSILDAQNAFDGLSQPDVVSWNAMLGAYVQQGEPENALLLYDKLQVSGVNPTNRTFVSILQACGILAEKEGAAVVSGRPTKVKALARGRKVHGDALRKGYDKDVFVGSTLVSMYGKCGSIMDAKNVFNGLSQRTVVSCNTMLAAYVEQGQAAEALQLYKEMRNQGLSPDDRTFVSALQACGMLAENEEGDMDLRLRKSQCLNMGRLIHTDLQKKGYDSDVFVGSILITMYGKCGSFVDAQNVFERLSQRDVVSWNALLAAYAQLRQADTALLLYEQMLEEGVSPTVRTFVSTLQACSMLADGEQDVVVGGQCTKAKSLVLGKSIHADTQRRGYDLDVFVGNTLVSMYWKCGSFVDAHHVFDMLSRRDTVSWNVMLAAQVEQGQAEQALQMYEQLLEEGDSPDAWTFVSALQAHGMLAERENQVLVINGQSLKLNFVAKGKALHRHAQGKGYCSDVFVGNTLVSMYGKCGSIVDARTIFDGLAQHDVVSWNAMLAAYVEEGRAGEAFHLYEQMHLKGTSRDTWTFVSVLQACGILAEHEAEIVMDGEITKVESLGKGKAVHADAIITGCDSDIFVSSTLVSMYGKCGSIVDAQNIFEGLSQREVVSWNAMLAAYAQCGQPEKALKLYEQMREQGVSQNDRTFVSVLQACGMLADRVEDVAAGGKSPRVSCLDLGKEIHADAERKGYDTTLFVGNTLVSMYGKCGSVLDARNVFDGLSHRDVVSWNAMLTAYLEQGQPEKALELHEKMQQEGVSPDVRTFVSVLQACGMLAEEEENVVVDGQLTKSASLKKGKRIHADAQKRGHDLDVFVGNTLVSMYGKCGSIVDAQSVFDLLSHRDVVSWNAMLAAYVEEGQGEKVLQLYEQMRNEGVSPDVRTVVSALQACAIPAEKGVDMAVNGSSIRIKSLEMGRAIHADAQKKGYISDVFVSSTLVSMYGKYGSIADAEDVFYGSPHRDVVLCNVMLTAYVQQGQAEKALQLYETMVKEDTTPDARSLMAALQACGMLAEKEQGVLVEGQSTKLKALEKGMAIHADVRRNGFDMDIFVGNALVTMYGKCGSIQDSKNVFDRLSHRDVVTWNALLAAYSQQGHADKVLELFEQMEEQGMSPDARTFVSTLQACGMLAEKEEDSVVDGQSTKLMLLEKGKCIHKHAQQKGYESDVFVASTLVSMYGKCGSIADAENVFDTYSERHVVLWNAMLAACAQQGLLDKAYGLYRQMQKDGVKPDEITLLCLLQACSNAGSLAILRQMHYSFVSASHKLSPLVVNTLISAYGRCGSMVDAQALFDEMPQPDVVSWNALMAGYTREGNSMGSMQCYERMQLTGKAPNGVTFVALLSACSHAGLVDKGVEYFESMGRDHGIVPEIEHYVSMVDLFGRAGCFTRVEELLSTLPMQPDLSIWLCLLGACRKHGKVLLGERAFECAVRLQPQHAAAYVLMSNIYAHAGLWDLAENVKDLRQKEGAWKMPGRSWIEHRQEVHGFVVGDHSHAQQQQLYSMLGNVNSNLKVGKNL